MNKQKSNSRRNFLGTLAAGAGLTMLPNPLQANISPELFKSSKGVSNNIDTMLKQTGKKAHPVAYDVSQANQWGFVWSNVYYITNDDTEPQQLGVINVLRHHGILFALNDEVIKKYKMGEVMNYKDPITKEFAVRNPFYEPVEGVYPVPGLDGIKGLQAKGAKFFVCNMALKVYSGFIGDAHGKKAEDVYNDFIANKHPGIELAPSGVWVLGRLAENGIAYIDASVG